MTVTTDFNYLEENRLAKVVLAHVSNNKRRAFTSWVKEDLSLNSSVSYVSPFEDLLADKITATETAKGVVGVTGGVLPGWLGDLAQKIADSPTLKNATLSISRWHSTGKISFEIPMTFITLNSKSDVMREAVELTSLAQPKVTDEGFLSAPGGYKPRYGDKTLDQIESAGEVLDVIKYRNFTTDGAWSVNIGEWFYAPNLLLTSAAMTISKERTQYGPLMVTVQCSFEPFRQVSEDEYRDYFRGSTFSQSAGTDLSLASGRGGRLRRTRNRENRRRLYNLALDLIPNL